MYTLPQLLEEDVTVLDGALHDLLARTDASTALITDKAGFCLVQQGETERFDVTSVAALASGSFEATQAIARIIDEPNFSCVYQQGEHFSMLVNNIDEQTVLIVIFPSGVSVGL